MNPDQLVAIDVHVHLEPAGELTEKGSINQRAVLRNRANLIDELYAGSPRVIEVGL